MELKNNKSTSLFNKIYKKEKVENYTKAKSQRYVTELFKEPILEKEEISSDLISNIIVKEDRSDYDRQKSFE